MKIETNKITDELIRVTVLNSKTIYNSKCQNKILEIVHTQERKADDHVIRNCTVKESTNYFY